MAAHLKTGLEQCLQAINEGKFDKAWIEPAVNLSCWTEDHTDTWYALYWFVQDKKTLAELKEELIGLLAEATIQWQDLGQPSTREDWHKVKYGE